MTSFFIWISLFSSLNKLSNIISVSNSELRIAVGCPLLRWLQGNNHSRLLDSFTRKIFMEHLVISSSVHLTAGFLQNISLGFSNTTFIKQKKTDAWLIQPNPTQWIFITCHVDTILLDRQRRITLYWTAVKPTVSCQNGFSNTYIVIFLLLSILLNSHFHNVFQGSKSGPVPLFAAKVSCRERLLLDLGPSFILEPKY